MFNKNNIIKNRVSKKGTVLIPVFIVGFVIIMIIAVVIGGLSILWLAFRNYIIAFFGALLVKISIAFFSKKKKGKNGLSVPTRG